MLLEEQLGEELRKRKLTIAVAESCTGGLLGSRITDVAGSSEYFLGGAIAYQNEVKEALLHVPHRGLRCGELRDSRGNGEGLSRAVQGRHRRLHHRDRWPGGRKR